MASTSVLSPERRIELNPFDVDAWNLLLREAQARPIDQARSFYEKLVAQFYNAGRYWKAYIEHELRAKNFENVENLFKRCLLQVLNIDLWKCYVFYVRETKGHLHTFRENMAQTFDFALESMGLDIHSYSLYVDYIAYLKSVPAVGQFAENQRISAIRKIYQRGISTPMINIEQLWNDYCGYEKSVNQTLAEKLVIEKNKDYQLARRVTKALEQVTRGINRQAISIPPRGTTAELKQVELWRKYIQWEKTNPLHTEEYGHYAKRVIFVYEQCLLCLGYMPDIWYEAALFQQKAAHQLMEKGDVKSATTMAKDVIQLYERAISGIMKDSQLLYFAYADFEEERRNYENVRKIYDRLLTRDSNDPSLPYIQLMKFIRRTEGVKASRAVFKRARADPRVKFHVYVAAATMEYYCSKSTQIAMRIFDLGLKRFSTDPDYALAYVEFLSHLNEDNNTRVVFERILNSGALSSEKAVDIWDRYLEFESQVGDLTSILMVDERRREAVKDLFEDRQALLLIDRYKFLNLAPCTPDQLKFMGYNKQVRYMAGMGGSTGQVLQNGKGPADSTAASTKMGSGMANVEISGYPRPDTNQMLPFKPKLPPAIGYHPVAGGVYPAPPAVAQLMQMLPPPWTFMGPFPDIEKLMESLGNFNREPPRVNMKDTLDPNITFGGYKAADVKKEFYQLLSTTNDPAMVIASHDYQQQLNQSRKRHMAHDSDSDDESSRVIASTGDIYKRRMNMKTAV